MVSRPRATGVPYMMIVAGFVVGLLAATTAPPAAAAISRHGATSPAEARKRQEWQRAMARLPAPGKGCFRSSYPQREWHPVACATPPNLPYPPARGPRPQTVGNSNDFAAEVTGMISGATGSFDSVSGVTSETGVVGGSGPQVANTYSLQLNTKPFTTSVCSANPGCLGWQQFLYTTGFGTYIQYWLLRYNTTCPSGWTSFSFPPPDDADVYCYRNSLGVSVAAEPITNLATMTLTGTATAGGDDTVVVTAAASGTSNIANVDTVLDLASGWRGVEFITVGDCCGSQANFNAGSTLVVRTVVHNGTMNAPACVLEGFTGETNNLNLVGTPPIPTAPSPSIVSTQTNSPGSAASCATAAGIGDTHLTTFGGLLYDFQASGDFVLAQTGPDFIVQVRQVSGAPTWPNASVNKAVGVRVGKSKVSLCLGERPLKVDGEVVGLADGKVLLLPGGGDVARYGNVYLIRGASGDSVRAEINSGWINVTVGLGRWPAQVRGLLANANNSVNSIAARDGSVLTAPFSFAALYGRYGDSWRVQRGESLIDCGDGGVQGGNPEKPFYARDLPRQVYRRARAICVDAGVRKGPLLDACTLDVAVIGDKAAAGVFVRMPVPNATGPIVTGGY